MPPAAAACRGPRWRAASGPPIPRCVRRRRRLQHPADLRRASAGAMPAARMAAARSRHQRHDHPRAARSRPHASATSGTSVSSRSPVTVSSASSARARPSDVEQPVDRTPGRQRRDSAEVLPTQEGAHQRRQRGRRGLRLAQRTVHLETLPVGNAELQVPPVVLAAGPAPHGRAGSGQRVRGSVEVGGGEHHLVRRRDRGDPADVREVGQRLPFRDVVLRLDLQVRLHPRSVVLMRRARASRTR